METMLLKEPTIALTEQVLQKALGKNFPVYDEFLKIVTGKDYQLTPVWNYYNDGKAWLCKVQFKNKTIFWLSVWDRYFKIVFYFTDKTGKGIHELHIDSNIKKNFIQHPPVGRFLPLVIAVNKKSQLEDVLKIVAYKKSLK